MSNLEVKKSSTPAMTSSSLSTSVEASDIEIPKILLMQGLSDFVSEGKAAMGDLVDSLTAEKLGGAKQTLKIIPICMWKDFLITEKQGNKFEFKEVKPYNTETMHWREFEHREYEENGVPHQRNLRMNYAVLLERDSKEYGAFPYVISFQRTGIKCGKSFANFFLKASTKKLPPWAYTLELGCRLEKNDQGNYYVPTLVGAVATPDLGTVGDTCETWASIFAKGAAKIDESSEVATGSTDGDEVPF